MSPAVIAERGGGFAALIGLVATHWSKIEQSLGIMYTYLLLGQEPSAFELYHKLIDLNLKINGDNPAIIQVGSTYNDLGATIIGPEADLNLGIRTFLNGTPETAFMAAAEDKLPKELIEEIKAFYKDLRKLSSRRAKIIHGTWCTTPTKPQSLLLADPRHLNQKLNEMFRYVVEVKKDHSKIKPKMEFPITPDEFQEYHVRDFQTLMSDLVDADNRAMELGNRALTHALALVSK